MNREENGMPETHSLPVAAAYLEHLMASRGWSPRHLMRELFIDYNPHRLPGGHTLEYSRISHWLKDGPPRSGDRHLALLGAFGIDPGSHAQAILQGKEKWTPAFGGVVERLSRFALAYDGASLAHASNRGLRPTAKGEDDLPEFTIDSIVQIEITAPEPAFILIIDHSHSNSAIFIIYPDENHVSIASQKQSGELKFPVNSAGYPIGGPIGRNDLYIILSDSAFGIPESFFMPQALTSYKQIHLEQLIDKNAIQIKKVIKLSYLVINRTRK